MRKYQGGGDCLKKKRWQVADNEKEFKDSYHNLADTWSSTTPIAPRCLHTL